jgi:hypothetical protein
MASHFWGPSGLFDLAQQFITAHIVTTLGSTLAIPDVRAYSCISSNNCSARSGASGDSEVAHAEMTEVKLVTSGVAYESLTIMAFWHMFTKTASAFAAD